MEEIKALVEKKKKIELSPEDKEKLNVIEMLIANEAMFFQLDMQTAYGILQFLGIEDEKLSEYYTRLISIDNYSKIPSIYTLNEDLLDVQKENER